MTGFMKGQDDSIGCRYEVSKSDTIGNNSKFLHYITMTMVRMGRLSQGSHCHPTSSIPYGNFAKWESRTATQHLKSFYPQERESPFLVLSIKQNKGQTQLFWESTFYNSILSGCYRFSIICFPWKNKLGGRTPPLIGKESPFFAVHLSCTTQSRLDV